LIQACATLRDRGLDFRCAIVGEGPLEEALRAQVIQLGLGERVELTGPLGIQEIRRRLVEETQIFALACATESDGGMDNLPTVLMEAMGASLPCVSTRLAGVPEMVLHERTGYLTEERQPGAFADQLAKLLHDPVQCEAMGAAGLKHAEENFARDVTGQCLLRCFAELSGMRADAELKAKNPGIGSLLLKRTLRKLTTRQLRHGVKRVSSKHFDLAAFMAGRCSQGPTRTGSHSSGR
jgi:glycosyltransferase involved in cell wall biosynthesis